MGRMIKSIIIASFFTLFLTGVYAQDAKPLDRKSLAAAYQQDCKNTFNVDTLTYGDLNYCDYPSLPKEEKEGLLKHFYCKALANDNPGLCDMLGENERLTCRDYYGMYKFSLRYLLSLVITQSVTPEIVMAGTDCKLFNGVEGSRAFAQAFVKGDVSLCKGIKTNSNDDNFCEAIVSMDEGRTNNALTKDFILLLKAEKDLNKGYCEKINNNYLRIACFVNVDKNNPQVCKPDASVAFTTLKNRKCSGFEKR